MSHSTAPEGVGSEKWGQPVANCPIKYTILLTKKKEVHPVFTAYRKVALEVVLDIEIILDAKSCLSP